MAMFLAGLRGIDQEMLKAASHRLRVAAADLLAHHHSAAAARSS